LNGVCSHGIGCAPRDSGSVRISRDVFGSNALKTIERPSGAQLVGRFDGGLSSRRSSSPELSVRFTYNPNPLVRREEKTMSVPVGDHTGDELSCDASNVRRDVVPRVSSVTQISPP